MISLTIVLTDLCPNLHTKENKTKNDILVDCSFSFSPFLKNENVLQQNFASNCIFNWHIHMKKQFTLI